MKITVIGCGRWGSFLAWYLDRIGHEVTLYGRGGSKHLAQFRAVRSNGMVTLSGRIALTSDLKAGVASAETLVISVGTQGFRALMQQIAGLGLSGRTAVLCMKGLEASTGMRLTQILTARVRKSSSALSPRFPAGLSVFTTATICSATKSGPPQRM